MGKTIWKKNGIDCIISVFLVSKNPANRFRIFQYQPQKDPGSRGRHSFVLLSGLPSLDK